MSNDSVDICDIEPSSSSNTAEQDIISHTVAATQLPTAAAGVSGDHSRTLSELQHNVGESAPVIMYSLQMLMTCVMCWL